MNVIFLPKLLILTKSLYRYTLLLILDRWTNYFVFLFICFPLSFYLLFLPSSSGTQPPDFHGFGEATGSTPRMALPMMTKAIVSPLRSSPSFIFTHSETHHGPPFSPSPDCPVPQPLPIHNHPILWTLQHLRELG